MANHLSPENPVDRPQLKEILVASQPTPQPRLDSQIVVSSRISLSRNIASFPFFDACSVEQRNEIKQIIVDHVQFVSPNDSLEVIDCQQLKLLEHQFQLDLQSAIGLQFDEVGSGTCRELLAAKNQQGLLEAEELPIGLKTCDTLTKAAADSPREMAAAADTEFQSFLFLNHEDHLQIQVETPRDEIVDAWKIADQIDDALHHHLSFAFHSKLGFLTACPSLVGTGMRASVMLHLPASVATGKLPVLMKQLAQFNVIIREVFGDPGGGEFFRVTNLATLGYSEIDLLEQVKSAVIKAVELETESRQQELTRDSASLKKDSLDAIVELEALDLSEAGVLGCYSAIRLLSRIRLGLQLKLLTEIETGWLAGRIAIVHLKNQLQLAITKENYLTASQLRDRIKLLSGAIA